MVSRPVQIYLILDLHLGQVVTSPVYFFPQIPSFFLQIEGKIRNSICTYSIKIRNYAERVKKNDNG
jgi:hypothetical protein